MSNNIRASEEWLAGYLARSGKAVAPPAAPVGVKAGKVKAVEVSGVPEVWPKMNKTEAEFYLKLKATTPAYAFIGCQCITLRFAKRLSYTPDFITIDLEKNLVAWEVKGPYIWEDALVKLKVAPKLFPWIKFLMAQKKNGVWATRQICP